MKELLVMIGASGHGKVVADIAANSYEKIFFLDDDPEVKLCGKYPVVGTSAVIDDYVKKADFFVSIGNAAIRKKFMENLMEKSARIVSLIHPEAVIGSGVTIGEGTVLMAGAIINADATIGKGCIINTAASVDHDCRVGNYVHISVGAHLCGAVSVGAETWVGAGAVVSNNKTICGQCMIGAGAVVVKDITEKGTYVGVPAKRLEEINENINSGK